MAPVQTVSQIGEFGLINRIQEILPKASSEDVIVGIGDDAAIIKLDDDRVLLASCDMQVEDTHFNLEHITPYHLGRRVMAVNQSDIAAMGGKPKHAIVSMGMPQTFQMTLFDDIFRGMRDQLSDFGGLIIGGNLARTRDKLVLDIFLLGEAEANKVITRSSAQPGDRIFVTGILGAAAAGLHVLRIYGLTYPDELKSVVSAHLQPQPRIDVGIRIAGCGFATAMIDISDGLASDLGHICKQSRVGAEIFQERLPTAIDDIQRIPKIGCNALDLALNGGEDYELLFTMRRQTPDQVVEKITEDTKVDISEIGIVLPEGEGVFLRDNQIRRPLEAGGWDHFKGES